MARGLNKVLLIGNLGKDPEMKYTPQGTPMTTFSMAVTRRRQTPDGEWKDETEVLVSHCRLAKASRTMQ